MALNTPRAGQYVAPDGNTNQFKNDGAPESQGVHGLQLKNLGPGIAYVGGDADGDTTTMYPLEVNETVSMEILSPQKLYVRMTAASRLAWLSIAS